MDDRILYIEENGTVGLVFIAHGIDIEDAIECLPANCKYAKFTDNEILRVKYFNEFFGALDINFRGKPKIIIDLERAREITKNRLRIEREPFFFKSDIALRDAMIDNDPVKLTIAAKERDRLRDITSDVDSITDIADLIAIHV